MVLQALSDKEIKFIDAILRGCATEEAAATVGISRRTGFLWVKKPKIQEAINRGSHETVKVIEEVHQERVRAVLPKVSALLEDATPKAVKTLIDLMENAVKEDIRLKASVEILKIGGIEKVSRSETKETTPVSQGLTNESAELIRARILGITQNSNN